MDRTTFLQSILGEGGYYCVAGIKPGTPVIHKYYDSVDALLVTADDLARNGTNAYFALGTMLDPKAGRKQGNVNQLRSLFLDIDCGGNHANAAKYETPEAALGSLKTFCKSLGLPRPGMVSSGNGLHVYWPLEQPLDREAWFPLATRLKELCTEHQLHADPAITTDAARILRVPGTFNYKTDPARPVELLTTPAAARSADFYRTLLGEPLWLPKAARVASDDVMSSVLSYTDKRFSTIMKRSLNGKGCGHLAAIYAERATMPEPLWRAALSIAQFCVDRDTAIHRISTGHPGYSPDSTEAKAASIPAPFLCDTLRGLAVGSGLPDACAECAFKGKISSPISLGKEVPRATEEDNHVQARPEASASDDVFTYIIPKYPDPYFRGQRGGVYKRVVKDDVADDVLVYPDDLYVVRRLHDKSVGDCIVLRLHLPHDGVREFTLPMSVVSTTDEFRKQMYAKGVTAVSMDNVKHYLLASVRDLQMNEKAKAAHRQFGWTTEHCTAFALGDKEVHAGMLEYNPPTATTEHLFPVFQKSGSMDEWRAAMEFYQRPNMELHQFVIGLSFGSIFTQFTAVNSAILHMFSPESGLGKTTALLAASSIWGNPARIVLKESDTFNSKMLRAEVYKNIILPMDEVTNASPKELSDFAYQHASGEQRNRMAMNGNHERVRGSTWRQMVVSTGNSSIIEKIMAFKAVPKGEMMRIMEVRVNKVPDLTKADTDALSMRLLSNYGHAAVPFLQYVMQDIDGIRRLHKSVQEKVDAEFNLTYQERFYSVLITNALTGLIAAKQAGLLNFPVAPVMAWAKLAVYHAMAQADSVTSDPEQLLMLFWAENYNNTLRIKSTQDLRGTSATDENDQFIVADGTPRGALVMRYEYDLKHLYIVPIALRDWCVKKQISFTGLLEGLKFGRTKGRMVRKRLGKGTRTNLPPIQALLIDCEWLDENLVAQTSAADAES